MAKDKLRHLEYTCRDGKAKRARIPSRSRNIFKDVKTIKLSEKKDWKNATCSVCMEAPHNAVLLLCSSYNKGCRPYMCATSYRFSNCLDQYKKAYKKATSVTSEETEVCELLCPLCRGQVKGWTLVVPARKHLNKKKRSCMQEKCLFVGNYKQLKKHVKADHPWARPRKVDPLLEEKWKRLEDERQIDDVISTLPPGSVIMGDYVIDPNTDPFLDSDTEIYLSSDDDLGLFNRNTFGRGGFNFDTETDDSLDSDIDYSDSDSDVVIPPRRQNNRRVVYIGRPRRR